VGKSSLLGCFNRERVEEDNDGADENEATDSGKKDKKKVKKKSKKNEPNIATDGIDIATAKWNKYVSAMPHTRSRCRSSNLPCLHQVSRSARGTLRARICITPRTSSSCPSAASTCSSSISFTCFRTSPTPLPLYASLRARQLNAIL
jgi:hypothetical protein